MTHYTFVAFSSADPIVSDTIVTAREGARSDEHDFTPWNRNDVSGQPIDRSVYGWVDTAGYQLTEEEFLSWQRAFETHGLAGLRAGRLGGGVRRCRAAFLNSAQLSRAGTLDGADFISNSFLVRPGLWIRHA